MPRPVVRPMQALVIRTDNGPGQGVAELRTGLRIGRDAAWVVIGCPRDQAGTEDPEQPRFGRLDNGLGPASMGCSISKAMCTSANLPPR
jgi:hypothetical protein